MAPIEFEQTLAELVLERPGRTRVFEELQLDYCCGGGRTLAESAAERGLDVRTLAIALEASESSTSGGSAGGGGRDWSEASLSELCDHIVDVHHSYLRSELPRIAELLAKVAAKHGGRRPELKLMESEFAVLQADLIEHIDREEQGVFLLCRSLDLDDPELSAVSPQFGMHEAAHEKVGETLARIRELAGGYEGEEGLCTSQRVLLQSLRDLERDLHLHIHKENNVLFPRLRERLALLAAPA